MKTRSMWEDISRRELEPYEHMSIALHESECIPGWRWEELVTDKDLNERYMAYRWCHHSEGHNQQAAKMFSSLYLQRRDPGR